MPMHRSNTSKNVKAGKSGCGGEGVTPWFSAHKKRQRTRAAMAKASRRKNRP